MGKSIFFLLLFHSSSSVDSAQIVCGVAFVVSHVHLCYASISAAVLVPELDFRQH